MYDSPAPMEKFIGHGCTYTFSNLYCAEHCISISGISYHRSKAKRRILLNYSAFILREVISYLQFLQANQVALLLYPPFADDWAVLNNAWSQRFSIAVEHLGDEVVTRVWFYL